MPDSHPRNTGSHREASRPERSPSSGLRRSLNSRTTQKFYSAAASNISNPTALAFMRRVFGSFYAGGTLLRALQLAEFSEGGESRRNEKHDHTVQISIYLHLALVFSAATPLTPPVAFSPSLCDHTLFFFLPRSRGLSHTRGLSIPPSLVSVSLLFWLYAPESLT